MRSSILYIGELRPETVRWLERKGYPKDALITARDIEVDGVAGEKPALLAPPLYCALSCNKSHVFADIIQHYTLTEALIFDLFDYAVYARENKTLKVRILLENLEVTESVVTMAEENLRRNCCSSAMYQFKNLFEFSPWDENVEIINLLKEALNKPSPNRAAKIKLN